MEKTGLFLEEITASNLSGSKTGWALEALASHFGDGSRMPQLEYSGCSGRNLCFSKNANDCSARARVWNEVLPEPIPRWRF